MQSTLSVAIITLNEEVNLPRTLGSVRFAEEVILIDSGSTDRTLEIAATFPNVKIFSEPWKGFSGQKNSAIEKCTSQWILSLDADEELSPELQIEMRTLLTGDPDADAYMLRRRNLFLNKWIQHGGFYPDPKLRLFRRHSANFTSTARFAERPVHETITFEGNLETLHHDIIHHAYPTLESYIEHMDRYSTLVPTSSTPRAKPAAPASPSTGTSSPSPALPLSKTTSSASASSTAARASCFTSTTPPTSAGSTPRPGAAPSNPAPPTSPAISPECGPPSEPLPPPASKTSRLYRLTMHNGR